MSDMVKYGYDFSDEDTAKVAAEVQGGADIKPLEKITEDKRNQDEKHADTTSGNK